MNETMVTLVGNVGSNEGPELRFTPNGVAVAKFRMACTPRKRDGDKFVDGQSSWYTVTAWRQLAENVAESLKKGDQVVVHGALSVREYEVDGQKRTSTEVDAYAIGVSLQFATAKPVKASGEKKTAAKPSTDDPWGSAQPAQPAQPAAARPAQAATPPSDQW